jgi:transcriptional regulator with XRE-family HTH domain
VSWLDEHQDWTVDGLASEVGVSASAVSLWLTKTKRVGPEHLVEVSRVTGEPLENLQRMVYGGRTPLVQEPAITLTADELEALLERAAERAVRRVLDEQAGGHAG